MKLFYYLDFFHYRETGKSVTGLNYYAWQFGPYPVKLGEKLDKCDPEFLEYFKINKKKSSNNKEYMQITPQKKFNDQFFTKRELKLLEQIAYIFKNAKAPDMVDSTHLKNHPWDKTIKEKGERAEIDYSLAFDENTVNKNEIIENIKDREDIEKAFQ